MKISEAQEQARVFEWVAWYKIRHPELGLLYAIANGGYRHKAEAANLKRQGIKAGMPDMCLPVARWGYHSMYIELKAVGGKLSEKQRKCIGELEKEGNRVAICYGADEAIQALKNYLGF